MGPRRDEYQSDKSKDKRDRNTNKRLFNYEIINCIKSAIGFSKYAIILGFDLSQNFGFFNFI